MTTAYAELVQLVHRFYYCLDERRYDDLVSLMREDCVWHRQGKVLNGHAMVRAALRLLGVRKRFSRSGGSWRIAESAGTLEFRGAK